MTLYDILEVSPNASKEVIEMAYKALAKKHHPDLNDEEFRDQCEENMKILNEARSILTNDELRIQYDQELLNYNANESEHVQPLEFIIPPRPWIRFFSRTIDLYFGTILIVMIWVIFSPKTYSAVFGNMNSYVAGVVLYILYLFIESFLLSTWGTTLGKWIFSSKVVCADGGKLKYTVALKRSFSMFFNGLGLSIPIVSLVTLSNSYSKLKDVGYGGFTKWDFQTRSAVITEKLKPIKIIIFIIVCIVGIVGYNYYIDNKAETAAKYDSEIQQLNKVKASLDKEKAFLTDWQNNLVTEYNDLTDLASKMKQWNDSGNVEEYNSNLDDYNNRIDIYNSQQKQFEARRLKYNDDIEAYNKKYLELTKNQ